MSFIFAHLVSGQDMADKKKTKEEIKVIVAVPCSDSDSMRAKTAQAIGAAIIGAEGVVVDFLLRQSCDIVSNRTWLVQEAIKKGGTHIFFADTDVYFPAYTIKQLLGHNKDIIGLDYNKRKFPLESTSQPLTDISKSATEPYKVKSAGMGAMLIKLSVFKRLMEFNEPFFNFGRDKEGKLVLGEDVWFINSAKDAGFDSWVDPTIKAGHIGEFLY